MREQTRERTSVETSNDRFNEILCRSAADLAMLMTDTPQGRYPYAGIPWYSTTFGRDGLITALADAVVVAGSGARRAAPPRRLSGQDRRSARRCAAGKDPARDARRRDGGAARSAVRPLLRQRRFDAALRAARPGSMSSAPATSRPFVELWPTIEAALAWIDGPGDPDGDGFVEYQRATEQGLANQGWKDSHDAIFHADGRLAEGAIALVEVQGYVYAAKRMAARCARRLGRDAAARQARRRSRAVSPSASRPRSGARRSRPMRWRSTARKSPARCARRMPDRCCSPALPLADRAPRVAKELLQPSFFSGWGIRTVASGEARYNPMSYHNGSIWPHDNALIALGLARYEHKRAIETLFEGLFSAATYMDQRRLPELFCGFQRQARPRPDALSGRLLAAGLGQRDAVHAARSLARSRIRSVQGRNPAAQSAPAGVSRRGDAARPAARRRRASICACAAMATPSRSIRPGSAAISGFRSFFRPERADFIAISAAPAPPSREPAGPWPA